MEDIRYVLSKNIRENRKKFCLTQAQLAERADISTNFVAMIELKHKFPTPEVLERIAGAFGIFLSVAGSIQMARRELEKLKEIRLEMHGENVSLARVLTHVSEVIVHDDPEFVRHAKYKPVDIAKELRLNPLTIAKVFRAAVAASPHAEMEDKVKEAEEITRAAIIYYPFTEDAEKAVELALGAQNILKWAQANRGQEGVPKIETAEEAMGLIMGFSSQTQITDPKKIAEYLPRIIGGLTPYGDSMAFTAALFGEATHLMTDSTGAPIVGFSARIGKFLYDFSKKTDKKTGQYLRPEMADLKTTEERLEYMHNIAMMRPQEVQGELMNYLNGITPEQEKEILKELKMDNNEVEAIMNMTEDQLKNLVGMPEEFIKEMRGRGLAIHWGAMVYFMTNKDAVERFRARLKDMKRKSQNPGQYYTSDIQARKNDELYKSAMLDEEIESAKMLSSMEYTDAGRFEKLRDHIFNNMMHRVGTPTLERYMQQYMTSWGATKDWLRLFESVESAMVETAKNTKALTADERMVAINAMMEMMRMIEDYMPNDLRKQVDSGGSRANALHSFFSSINNSNFSPSLKRGISGAVGRNVWQNDPTFTADVLKSHIGKTFSWEEVIIFAESALAESERYANYGTTINPSSPNYTTFSINYWKDKEKEDKKRLETFKRMKNEADRVAPQPQAQPAAQQPGLFNIPDPVAAEQEHREKAMVPWQNRLLENLSNPNYSVLAQMGGPGSKPLQKNAFVERQKQALQEREAQRQRFMDRQEASRMLNRHQPSFDQLRDMTKEERKQVVENRKKREAAFEEERSMARIDRNADKAKREYDNAVKRYRKTPEYEELSPEQKAFVDGKIKQSYSGAWSGGYGYHPQIKDNSLATEQLHNSWGEYQDKLREGREEMKEIRKQSGASDSPRNPETIAREIQAIEQARAARHKAEEDGILQTGGSRADLYKWHPGKGNAVTFDRLGRAKVVNQDEEDDKKIAQLKNEQQKAEFDERKRQADESRDKYEQMIQGWREERNAQLAERRSELVRNSRRSFEMEHRRKNPLPDGIFIPGEQKRIRDQQSNEEQPKPDDGLKNALLKIDKTLEQVAQLAPILTAFQSIVPAIKQIQDNQNEYARIVATNSATLGGHPAV